MNGRKSKKRMVSLTLPTFTILTLLLFSMPTIMAGSEVSIGFDPYPSNWPPYQPTNIYPQNGSTNINIPVELEVAVYDPTSSTVSVYFYNALDHSLIGVNYNVSADLSTATVTWSGLQRGTSYSWYAVARDSQYENASRIWSFATISPPSSPPQLNSPPTADANSLLLGYVNQTLVFDASKSYDPDGTIVGYRWDFTNDGTYDTSWLEETITTHAYADT
jgi:hypothetical protein